MNEVSDYHQRGSFEMALRRMPLVVALMLGTASAAFAQLTFEHNLKKDPYRNLFGDRDPTGKLTAPLIANSRGVPHRPVVVCGMVIVPADPGIDPKIRVAPPTDSVEYKLRTVRPPICKPE